MRDRLNNSRIKSDKLFQIKINCRTITSCFWGEEPEELESAKVFRRRLQRFWRDRNEIGDIRAVEPLNEAMSENYYAI